MNATPEPPEQRIQFTLSELFMFAFAITVGLALLVPTDRPEIKVANSMIVVLSIVLSSVIGLFASKPGTTNRILFILSGMAIGWLLAACLPSFLPDPKPERFSTISGGLSKKTLPLYSTQRTTQ